MGLGETIARPSPGTPQPSGANPDCNGHPPQRLQRGARERGAAAGARRQGGRREGPAPAPRNRERRPALGGPGQPHGQGVPLRRRADASGTHRQAGGGRVASHEGVGCGRDARPVRTRDRGGGPRGAWGRPAAVGGLRVRRGPAPMARPSMCHGTRGLGASPREGGGPRESHPGERRGRRRRSMPTTATRIPSRGGPASRGSRFGRSVAAGPAPRARPPPAARRFAADASGASPAATSPTTSGAGHARPWGRTGRARP